jgi:tetratricopeptide (TPR) repeat protein
VLLGLVLFGNNRLEEGAFEWHKVLANPERRVTAWHIAGLCARDAAIAAVVSDGLARAAASPAVPADVRSAAHATIGQILYNAGEYESALAAFTTACATREPQDVSCLWWRSRPLRAMGRIEEARQLLEQAYERDSDQILILVDLAAAHQELGDIDKAVELLTRYYEAYPEDPTAANNLAWALAEQGTDLDRALSLAKFAVRRRLSSAGFADTLGWVHIKRGDAESAIFTLNRAVELQPESASYRYHLGLAYRLGGQHEQAREAFAAAVELAPTPRPPWYEEALVGSTADPAGG